MPKEYDKETLQRYAKVKNTNYNANTVDRINFTVPKGRKADISAYAAGLGLSVNAFVSGLVLDTIDGKIPYIKE